MRIIVPATSANIGPGFDSIGVALSKYLIIEVLEESTEWLVEHNLVNIPKDHTNLLIQTALHVKSDLAPHRLKMFSDIPLARGLGSSSSVIVAGIELANQLGNLALSQKEKLEIATRLEGHPDNVAPAIFGDLVISSIVKNDIKSLEVMFPDSSFIAFIPNYELKTSDSRNVLPQKLSYEDAVASSSAANVMVASLLKGDLVTAGWAIERDLFHERYRQPLVKEFEVIKQISTQNGAYATYLSGAGPTVMVLCSKEKEQPIVTELSKLCLDGQIQVLNIERKGVRVEKR